MELEYWRDIMKKTILFFLVVFLSFALVACGSPKVENGDKTKETPADNGTTEQKVVLLEKVELKYPEGYVTALYRDGKEDAAHQYGANIEIDGEVFNCYLYNYKLDEEYLMAEDFEGLINFYKSTTDPFEEKQVAGKKAFQGSTSDATLFMLDVDADHVLVMSIMSSNGKAMFASEKVQNIINSVSFKF